MLADRLSSPVPKHRIARALLAGVQILVMGTLSFLLSVFCTAVVALVVSPWLAPAALIACGWCAIAACRGPECDPRFEDRPL